MCIARTKVTLPLTEAFCGIPGSSLARRGGYTLYHLSAPGHPDPNSRHERAQIRTAFSHDLRTWHDTGFALLSGPPGSWDDGPIWTGCTLCEDQS